MTQAGLLLTRTRVGLALWLTRAPCGQEPPMAYQGGAQQETYQGEPLSYQGELV